MLFKFQKIGGRINGVRVSSKNVENQKVLMNADLTMFVAFLLFS